MTVQALVADVAPRTKRKPRWTPWDTRALVVVAAALGVRAYLLSQAWFWQDDFLVADGASRAPWGPAWVLQNYNGHLEPLKFSQIWLMDRTVGMSWVAAAAITLAWSAAFGIGFWAMSRRVLRPGPAALAATAVAVFCPLWSVSVSWFASAMESLPAITLMTLCAWCAVGVVRGRSPWWGVGSVLAFALALLWYEKAVLGLLLVLLAVLAARASHDDARLGRRASVLTAVGLLGVAGAFAAVFLLGLGAPPTSSPDRSDVLRLVYEITLSVVPTGLEGGPWQQNNDGSTLQVLITQPWIVWIWAAMLGVAAVAWRRHRPMLLLGGVIFLVALTIDVALVARSRIDFLGPVIGRDTRYTVDVVPLAALALGLAIGGGRRLSLPRLSSSARRAMTAGAMALALLYGIVSWPSVHAVAQSRASIGAREWVEAATEAVVVDPSRVFVGTPVPARIVSTAFGDSALSSHVLPLFGVDATRFDQPATEWWVLDQSGAAVPVTFISEIGGEVGRAPGCGVAIRGQPVTLPVPAVPAPRVGQVRAVRLSYYSAGPATVVIESGDLRTELDLPPGIGYAYLPYPAVSGELRIGGLTDDQAVCIAALGVGSVG
jgi:hypothetical protein